MAALEDAGLSITMRDVQIDQAASCLEISAEQESMMFGPSSETGKRESDKERELRMKLERLQSETKADREQLEAFILERYPKSVDWIVTRDHFGKPVVEELR